MLIAHSPFGKPGGAIALAKVAAFHGHAVQPVHEPGELGAVFLQDGHELDAGGLEALLVLGVTGGTLGRGVGELLELDPGRGVLGADLLFDLAAGRGAALRLEAGGELLQAEVALDGTHEDFLALVVLGVADDLAGMSDPVGQNMNVLVLGVGVAGDEVLVVDEVHAVQIAAADFLPLGVGEVFSRGGGERNVQDSLFEIRAQFSDGAELGRQFVYAFPGHVGVEDLAFVLA